MKLKLNPNSTESELNAYLEEFSKERGIDIYTTHGQCPKGLLVVGVSFEGDVMSHWNYHPMRTGLQLTHTTPHSYESVVTVDYIKPIMARSMEVIASLYAPAASSTQAGA